MLCTPYRATSRFILSAVTPGYTCEARSAAAQGCVPQGGFNRGSVHILNGFAKGFLGIMWVQAQTTERAGRLRSKPVPICNPNKQERQTGNAHTTLPGQLAGC
jgi:hypothetical protein